MTARSITQHEYDICESRHGGNPESRAAFKRIKASMPKTRDDVLSLVRIYSSADGITSRGIALALDKPLHAISGRITELLKRKKIKRTGELRGGCSVLVLREEV